MRINWIGLYTMLVREVERTFRVSVQTLVSPVISAALYIFIFGHVIGSRISEIGGVSYITFVFPGILVLSVINAAFSATSSSLYFARFTRGIEEILITPFSYVEMIVGYVLGGVARAVLVATLIMGVGVAFGAVSLNAPALFFLYTIGIAAIFSLLGILVGLWAQGFEQLSVLNTFVITPLTYLGGIFYSITMLPATVRTLTELNPFFYFVDGVRGAMIGIHEGSTIVGSLMVVGLLTGLSLLTLSLFKAGWRIRN